MIRPLAVAGVAALGVACIAAPSPPTNEVALGPLSLAAVEHASSARLSEFSVPVLDWESEPPCTSELRYAVVEVGADRIAVDSAVVVALDAGRVPPADLRGQLIEKLFDPLTELQEQAKQGAEYRCTPWARAGESPKAQPRLVLAIDGGVPFATTRQIVYTAGQAQFVDLAFAVEDDTPNRARPAALSRTTGDTPRTAAVVDTLADGHRVSAVGFQAVDVASEPGALGRALVPLRDRESPPHAVFYAPLPSMATADVLTTASRISVFEDRGLFPNIYLASGPSEEEPPAKASFTGGESRTWSEDATLPVLWMQPVPFGDAFALPTATERTPKPDSLTIGAPAIVGDLDVHRASEVFRAHGNQFRYCRDTYRTRPGAIALVLRATVLADGSVGDATIVSSTVREPELGACLLDKLRGMTFDPVPAGAMITAIKVGFAA